MAGYIMTDQEYEEHKQWLAQIHKPMSKEEETAKMGELVIALVQQGHTIDVMSPNGRGFRVRHKEQE